MLKNLFVLTALLLSSCASVEVPDFEACADLSPDGAYCANFITPQTRAIESQIWERMRIGRLSLSPEDFSALKASIEKLCSVKRSRCTYEQREIIEDFFHRLEMR